MRTRKTAVLIASHFIDGSIEERYRKIRRELPGELYDVVLLVNGRPEEVGVPCVFYPTDEICGFYGIPETFVSSDGKEYGMMWCLTHMMAVRFMADNPDYGHCWFIEYDVFCNGSWHDFMKRFEADQSDFLTTRIMRYGHCEREWEWIWKWHSTMKGTMRQEMADTWYSFNPMCRMSRKAASLLHESLLEGTYAYSELLLPTVLTCGGMQCRDIYSESDFGLWTWEKDKMRDIEASGRFTKCDNRLYHPVKSCPMDLVK